MIKDAIKDVNAMMQCWRNNPRKLITYATHTFRSKKQPLQFDNIISFKILEVKPYSEVIVDAKVFVVTREFSAIYMLRFIAESAPYFPATHRKVLGISFRNKFRFNPISLRKI